MFYKVLFLEILAVLGLIGLRVHQSLPETRLEIGERTVTIKAKQDETVAKVPTLRPQTVRSLEEGGLVFPVADHGIDDVISIFGDKRGKRSHQGIDIKAPRGTAVVATVNGFIERVKEGGNGGKQIYLRGATGRLFYYAHLDSWSVEEYTAVEAGDVIGTIGDTGNARGTTPHLHFEVLLGKKKEAIDPLRFWAGV
ncbi:MAG: M23 family metallopeptidase [Bacteroidota bacterium]